ncbi:MAG: DUF4835 family protein [Chitinophagaceae bacterium]|nr:DUF4835 family protein [Chitinophagaceae bacterium]
MKKIIYCIIAVLFIVPCKAQEFNCKAIVNASQVANVDQKIFKTLEQSLADFFNKRKWTRDNFEPQEKLDCVISLLINSKIEGLDGGYTAKLSIQYTRPVFNSSFNSTMVNYVDNNVAFKYLQFQPLDFADNNVSGSDALASNLSATLAFYAYFMLGIDYDSFSLKGGTEHFNKALNVVSNAPEGGAISGWKASENNRNRFWLIDQMLNNRFSEMRTVNYNYHILGMDKMTKEKEAGKASIFECFTKLQKVNNENPSSLIMQFFFNAKNEEIVDFLKSCTPEEKQQYVPIVAQIDVTNSNKYLPILK